MKFLKTVLALLVCFAVLMLSACDSDVPFVEVDSSDLSGQRAETSDTAEKPDDTDSGKAGDKSDSGVTNSTATENTTDPGTSSKSDPAKDNASKETSSKKTNNTSSKQNKPQPTPSIPSNIDVEDIPTVEAGEEEVFEAPPTPDTPSGSDASITPTQSVVTSSAASAATTSSKPVTYGNYKALADTDRFCYKYGNLNTAEKRIYDDLKNAVKDKTSMVYFPSTPSPAIVVFILQCVTDDYPEYFWVDSSYSFTTNPSGNCTSLTFHYLDSTAEDSAKLATAVSNFKQSVPDGLSDYEVELMAHDFICEATYYDADTAYNNSTDNIFARTAYGALVGGSSVCEGYSRAMELLLYSVGIECSLVRGNTGDESHMWNQALIGGSWYNVDVTWDDPMNMPEASPIYYFHAFLNITDEELAEANHEMCPLFSRNSNMALSNGSVTDMFNIAIKSCTATKMNYYVKSSARLSSGSTDESIIGAAVLKADSEGLNYCELQATGSSAFTNSTKGMAQLIFNAFKRGIRVGYVMPNGVNGKYLVYWTFT